MLVRRIRAAALPTLALLALTAVPAAPAQAGTPGSWTKVSGTNSVSSLAVAAVSRTADGELLVAYPSEDGVGKSVRGARLTAGGTLITEERLDGGYDTMNRFVALGQAGNFTTVAYGPYAADPPGGPYSDGGIHRLTFSADTDTWSFNLSPMLADPHGNSATGIGTVLLDDYTAVTAITDGAAIKFSADPAGTVNSFSQSNCCAYYATVVADGSNAAVAWQGNGGTADSTGVFARQIYPGLGTIYLAPKSQSFTGSSYALSMSDQPTAAVQRNDGFTYLAYPFGYPDRVGVSLWRASDPTGNYITAGKDAKLVALATGPSGRMWLAWSLPNNTIKLLRTSPTGMALGGIRTLSKPAAASGIYQIALEATNGKVDVVINGGTGLFHTQVKPGLQLSASPQRWPAHQAQKVVFTLKDAGSPVANGKVKAAGKSCTTSATGRCALKFPARSRGRFKATATASGYAQDRVTLRVR